MLKSLCLTLSLALCASLPALSQPGKARSTMVLVRFHTDPPDAELSYNGNFLGTAEKEITLDTKPLGSTVEFTVSKAGYQPELLMIRLEQLKAGRAPVSGILKLRRSGWRGFLEAKAPVLGGFVLGLGVLGAFSLRQRKQSRELERREQMLAQIDRSDSLTAQTLGDFRLMNILGKGGMATVYKAVPAATMNPREAVAVKVLRKEIAESTEFMARFRQEAQVTNRLNHPHIVRLIDWGTERDYVYLVVELIEGGDLRSRLTGQPLPASEVWSALNAICAGVSYAHSQGVVHRDLKPENFLITQNGILKVADFGLARSEDQERLTATGTTLGTPAYMAPEQIQGSAPHPSMDQYAIGVIAYELVTGRLPFNAADPV
ncbi:MAG: serine/threonine protein kinase, partial [Candidatus Eremiobacteraeota bacterium]|nr:serine/threonine protein kinase [Candidatus Eremiobacteraeota bacterium]